MEIIEARNHSTMASTGIWVCYAPDTENVVVSTFFDEGAPNLSTSILSGFLPFSGIPTPPAAPPTITATYSPTPTPPPLYQLSTSPQRVGRIRILNLQGSPLGYLSKFLDEDGDCQITYVVSEAQTVRFSLSHRPTSEVYIDVSYASTLGTRLG